MRNAFVPPPGRGPTSGPPEGGRRSTPCNMEESPEFTPAGHPFRDPSTTAAPEAATGSTPLKTVEEPTTPAKPRGRTTPPTGGHGFARGHPPRLEGPTGTLHWRTPSTPGGTHRYTSLAAGSPACWSCPLEESGKYLRPHAMGAPPRRSEGHKPTPTHGGHYRTVSTTRLQATTASAMAELRRIEPPAAPPKQELKPTPTSDTPPHGMGRAATPHHPTRRRRSGTQAHPGGGASATERGPAPATAGTSLHGLVERFSHAGRRSGQMRARRPRDGIVPLRILRNSGRAPGRAATADHFCRCGPGPRPSPWEGDAANIVCHGPGPPALFRRLGRSGGAPAIAGRDAEFLAAARLAV